MTKEDKDKLIKNRMYICKQLDFRRVKDFLMQEKIINKDNVQRFVYVSVLSTRVHVCFALYCVVEHISIE